MSQLVTRREFCAVTLAGVAASVRARGLVAPPNLHIGIVAPPTAARNGAIRNALDGLALGLSEASRTATLFGTRVTTTSAEVAGGAAAATAVRRAVDGGASATCIALPSDDAFAAHAAASQSAHLCIDLTTRAPAAADRLNMTDAADDWTAYVVPSADSHAAAVLHELDGELQGWWAAAAPSMLLSSGATSKLRALAAAMPSSAAAAAVLALAANGTVTQTPGAGIVVLAALTSGEAATLLLQHRAGWYDATVIDLFGATTDIPRRELPQRLVRAVSWLPGLFRYGAAQLNDRFRARYGADATMDGAAWGGWFAAKAVIESALRSADATPRAMRQQLLALRFDGHKGTPLEFNGHGELVQPLYVTGAPDEEKR